LRCPPFSALSQKLKLPNKNYSFFSRYENFLESAIVRRTMQYLSQRLAAQSPGTRDADPQRPSAKSQRDRLLDAAEALIAKRGAGKTTIEAIIKRAGVSSVSFYEHFRNKEECFAAAFERAAEELRDVVRASVPAGGARIERVRSGLEALLAALDADPARGRLCFVEAQKDGPLMRARYEEALDAAAAELDDPLGDAIAGGFAWLVRERLELSGGGSLRELLPEMTEVALSPHTAHG
jgi:AcrR family transcriptional regulator